MHFIWYHYARHRVVYTMYPMNYALQWRHNECNSVSHHRRLDCLLIVFYGCRTKKTSKPRVTGLYEGNPPVTGGSPHKGPVTRKCFHLMTSSWWSRFYCALFCWDHNINKLVLHFHPYSLGFLHWHWVRLRQCQWSISWKTRILSTMI